MSTSLSAKALKTNKQLVALFDDIYAKNLVDIPDRKIAVTNSHYLNIGTELILQPNKQYIISFDYHINSADAAISCGIGYGSRNGVASYRKDIVYGEAYPNQKEGNFTYVFLTPMKFLTECGEPYLSVRLARMSVAGNYDIDISNFRFKLAPEDLQPDKSLYVKRLTLTASGSYFTQYYSTMILEPSTKYTISFNYNIKSASSALGCGIGYGRSGTGLKGGTYIKDIAYSVKYPNQEKGTFKYTFTTPATFTMEKPYLSLRLARMNSPGNYVVEFTDIIVRRANI